MNLPVMALFVRSMRTDARSLTTYALRMLLVSVMLVCLIVAYQTSQWTGAPGLSFFSFVLYVNLFVITLAMLPYFTSAITEEKEDMTLGLLRMTGLGALSILFGKSVSRLLGALMLLLAQFPFTLLAITLGGVGIEQIVAAYWAMGAYIVMIAGVSLLLSVVCTTTRDATALAVVLLFLFHVGPWISDWFVDLLKNAGLIWYDNLLALAAHRVSEWLKGASAFVRGSEILATGFSEGAFGFQVATNLAAGGAGFLLAWAGFDVANREQNPGGPGRGPLRIRRLRPGWLSARRAWKWALVWKEFHFTTGGMVMMGVKTLGYGALMGFILYANRRYRGGGIDWDDAGMGLLSTAFFIGWLECCAYAGRTFGDERKWKTLSSVMTLPHSLPQLAYSKVLGCLLGLIPAAAYFLVGAVLAGDQFADLLDDMLSEAGGWYFLSLLFFVPHLAALLSLYVKWGATLLAILLTIIGSMTCVMVVGIMSIGTSGEAALGMMAIALFAASGCLHLAIAHRLHEVAAQ